MVYRVIIDGVILIHFIWIVFVLFGFFLSLKYRYISFIHIAGLVFTLALNIGGWYCPLTHLEGYLYEQASIESAYAGSFIANYLGKLIYLRIDESYLRTGAVLWAGLNLGGYGWLLTKKWRENRTGRQANS